jgi:N-acetylglucosaminyldiphosphoundecaprenol N-acetyl-beta-D-mannosaminyltransferase
MHISKKNILGILISPSTYNDAVQFIIGASQERRSAAISALAVHGVMTGVLDREHKFRLNQFDLLLPDGQPVRWALNLLHKSQLTDRVYGPTLMLKVCERAAAEGLSIYLYGSTPAVLQGLKESLQKRYPDLLIVGMESSKFRQLTPAERDEVAARIRCSQASILFVGLGCPKQEIFAYEFHKMLDMPIIAVGAAFPFIAGLLRQAPRWMGDFGLEWLFRLFCEPRRLWRRYVYLNPSYSLLVLLQVMKLASFSTKGQSPSSELMLG